MFYHGSNNKTLPFLNRVLIVALMMFISGKKLHEVEITVLTD